MAQYAIPISANTYPLIFLMVDNTDHITGKTGLSPTVTISKNGGAFASPSGTVSAVGNGWYAVSASTNDPSVLGPLILHATGTSADPTDVVFEVVSYNPQDSVRLGLTALPNAAAAASNGLPTLGSGTGQIIVSAGAVSMDWAAITNKTAANTFTQTIISGVSGAVTISGTSPLTESYAALHAAPTLAQILYEMRSLLAEVGVVTTTLTTKKIDGTTTAETFSLNDGTAPTAITRAS